MRRALFGGALSAVVPPGARDASELREVPDNQEVFAHEATDQSLVLELLELQHHVADRDAARFHLRDLAAGNGASGPGALEVTGGAVRVPEAELSLADCGSAWTLAGTQRVSKFDERARNTVLVHVGLLRVPRFRTDVLVSFNDPQSISPDSSSSSSSSSSSRAGDAHGDAHAEPWTVHDFRIMLQTLTLHDPGLFGPNQENQENQENQ